MKKKNVNLSVHCYVRKRKYHYIEMKIKLNKIIIIIIIGVYCHRYKWLPFYLFNSTYSQKYQYKVYVMLVFMRYNYIIVKKNTFQCRLCYLTLSL